MHVRKLLALLSSITAICLLAGACVPASMLGATVLLSTPDPDLIIEKITWSPENPSVGDTVTFTVDIKNQGGGQAGSSSVAYYIDDAFLGDDPVSPIDTGATATVAFTWEAQAGSHTIKAVADSNQTITESDEINNAKTFAFSILAPDLIIETINWSPESPSVKDEVTFTVTVKNEGNIRARYSRVYFYIDGSSRGYQGVEALDAGAAVSKTFTWVTQAGSHTIKAVADGLGHVAESDESNNEKTVIYSTASPDLIINNITWSPANPSQSANVTFTVSIKNQGSGNSYSSSVAYYVDDAYMTSAYVSPLNSGATAAKTFTWTTQEGSHTFKAVADANQEIAENDEANNTKTVSLPTLAPDIIVQGITWSPTSPLVAHQATFTVTVKNQGTSKAGESRVYFYIDGSYYGYHSAGELTADATVARTFIWAVLMGSHTIKAVADKEDYVAESNESNNEKTVSFPLSSPSPPDLIIQNIVWSPGNPSAGDNVTFTATIKNQGSGRASSSDVSYYIDDAYLTSAYVSPLDSDATATVAFIWEAQAGSHTIKAVADSDRSVGENNESNNEKTATISV